MKLVVNDLSEKPPSKDIYEGRKVMQDFLYIYHAARKIVRNDSVIMGRGYNTLLLADLYPISKWRNDQNVDRETRRLFGSLLNKAEYYEDYQDVNDNECSEFKHKDQVSIGCMIAHETENPVISFLSDNIWDINEINGTYTFLNTELDKIQDINAIIPNVSTLENVNTFKQKYESLCEKDLQVNIKNGEDILSSQQLSNIVFCDNAEKQLRSEQSLATLKQIFIRLIELHNNAEKSTPFDINSLKNGSSESTATLDKFKAEHTFRLPDGRMQLFKWHTRFTGAYAGRIFFEPDHARKKYYIGHIGPKIPTIKYN